MFKINKGCFAGKDVYEVTKSLGLEPTNVQKAVAVLEQCEVFEDLMDLHSSLKSACSDYVFTGETKNFIEDNEELAVSDFLLQLATNKAFDEAGKPTWKPFGSSLGQKAVNGSSSIQVSSEAYETTVSRGIMKEVWARTYVRDAIKNRVKMSSKRLTIPTLDKMVATEWIAASAFGSDNSTGTKWASLALTENTYTTFKLAAKGFISDETEEDAIIALLPLLRQALVDAIATDINKAMLSGDGKTVPVTGLLKLAVKAELDVTGKSLLTAGQKGVCGRDILRAKHSIDPKCRKNSKLVLIASQTALADLEGDEQFQDASQVGERRASKLQGWVGNFYNIPVIEGWNDDFGWANDAAAVNGEPLAILVAVDNFAVFEQREVTTEYNRNAEAQRDEYFVTTRVNLEQIKFKDKNAVCVIKKA